jgi:hypothetical protein
MSGPSAAQRRDKAQEYAFLAFLQSIAAQRTARLCERGVPGYRQRFDSLYIRWSDKYRDMIARGERVFREAISTKNRPDTDYAKLEQVEKAIAELAQSPRDTSPITLDDRMRAACEESLVELEASLNS